MNLKKAIDSRHANNAGFEMVICEFLSSSFRRCHSISTLNRYFTRKFDGQIASDIVSNSLTFCLLAQAYYNSCSSVAV